MGELQTPGELFDRWVTNRQHHGTADGFTTLAGELVADLRQQLAAATARAEQAEEQRDGLAHFNPDWDMLAATQASLREHMEMVRVERQRAEAAEAREGQLRAFAQAVLNKRQVSDRDLGLALKHDLVSLFYFEGKSKAWHYEPTALLAGRQDQT